MNRSTTSRRGFLKHSATIGAAALAAPYFVPATAFGANEKIITGHIGVGGQGRGNLGRFMDHAAAICDVDQGHLAQAMKMAEKGKRTCDAYGDYRKMLERKDIDAVVITTPDHWHAANMIHSCQAGKDVYCEKPLSLTIDDGRKMVEAARKYDRVVQTGSQQRSDKKFRVACELVRSGAIGKLTEVHVGLAAANDPGEPVPNSDPPEELNYDFWIGPAPMRPYNLKCVHYNFRFHWDFSGGQTTNWGAHHLDIAHWGMGMDDSGPLEIEPLLVEFHPKMWHEVPEACRLKLKYPNDVTVIVGQQQKDIRGGTLFIGTKGRIHVDRSKMTADPKELADHPRSVELYTSDDHRNDFLNCVKTRNRPVCDVEIGHRSASVCHLANIAMRLNRTITWDAKSEQIVGDDQAAGMLKREYRKPWTI